MTIFAQDTMESFFNSAQRSRLPEITILNLDYKCERDERVREYKTEVCAVQYILTVQAQVLHQDWDIRSATPY